MLEWNANRHEFFVGRRFELQSEGLSLHVSVHAGIITSNKKDVQLVHPSTGLLAEPEITGRNTEFYVRPGRLLRHVGGDGNFTYVVRAPHGLLKAVVQGGRLLFKQITCSVTQSEPAPSVQLDIDGVILSIRRPLGRKTQHIGGMPVGNDPIELRSQISRASKTRPPVSRLLPGAQDLGPGAGPGWPRL